MFVQESIMKLADVARYVCGYDPIPFIPLMFSTYGVWHLRQFTKRFWGLGVKGYSVQYHRSKDISSDAERLS
jgi:hypothetical protein